MDISSVSSNYLNNYLTGTALQNKNKVQDESFSQKLTSAMEKKDEEELKKVCQEFEEIFLGMMYKQMKATIIKSDLMPECAGREIYESMMDDELVKKAAEGEGIGLAKALYEQLSKTL